MNQIYDYMSIDFLKTELREFLISKLRFSDARSLMFQFDHRNPWVLFDKSSFNWLRRLFYFARRVTCQACQFGLRISDYMTKIMEYYDKKELYLLRKMYELQETISLTDPDACACMYPEFLFQNGYSTMSYIEELDCIEPKLQIADADYYSYSNKKCHFKNAYLDSLALKRSSIKLFNIIKKYYNAKKCNEIIEAFAA